MSPPIKENSRALCWSCQKDPGKGHFCQMCRKIQPLGGEDYFSFLGLPKKMTLDASALEKNFYELSRRFHPDFFHWESDKEKLVSLEKSAFLNKAYHTLKNSIARAEYLLDLDVPAKAKERTQIAPALVTEIFEIQEMVEEGKNTKDPNLKAKLQEAQKEVEGKIAARGGLLERHFKEWDARGNDPTQKQALAKTIRTTIDEITYLKNLLQSIQTGGQVRH